MSSEPRPSAIATENSDRTVDAAGAGTPTDLARSIPSARSFSPSPILNPGAKSPSRARGKRLTKWCDRPQLVDSTS